MSNVGKWATQYRDVHTARHYGDSDSYRIGAEFLAPCPTIEDRGCGLGWFRRFTQPDQRYTGIDGSLSDFVDVVADLETYRSTTAGLFMRHVLEHNYRWDRVLDAAVASFTQRMVVAIFTPWADDEITVLGFEHDYGVPTLAFAPDDITDRLAPHSYEIVELADSPTFYGVEHVVLIEHR